MKDIECTGIVGRKNRNPDIAPDCLFSTMSQGIEEWYHYLAAKAEKKGWGTPDLRIDQMLVDPLYAGHKQTHLIALSDTDKHFIYMSIYKRDEGIRVYEITAYLT